MHAGCSGVVTGGSFQHNQGRVRAEGHAGVERALGGVEEGALTGGLGTEGLGEVDLGLAFGPDSESRAWLVVAASIVLSIGRRALEFALNRPDRRTGVILPRHSRGSPVREIPRVGSRRHRAH